MAREKKRLKSRGIIWFSPGADARTTPRRRRTAGLPAVSLGFASKSYKNRGEPREALGRCRCRRYLRGALARGVRAEGDTWSARSREDEAHNQRKCRNGLAAGDRCRVAKTGRVPHAVVRAASSAYTIATPSGRSSRLHGWSPRIDGSDEPAGREIAGFTRTGAETSSWRTRTRARADEFARSARPRGGCAQGGGDRRVGKCSRRGTQRIASNVEETADAGLNMDVAGAERRPRPDPPLREVFAAFA